MRFSSTTQHDGLSAAVDKLLRPLRKRLASCGTLVETSGCLRVAERMISIHSAFGPAEQSKQTNQDAAVIWSPGRAGPVRWAIALADGVSQSYGSSAASRLACFAALASLQRWHVEGGAPSPVADCARYFEHLGLGVEKHPERFRPANCFRDTWRRAVSRGQFLQTTLVLLWETSSHVYLSAVGDGGFILDHGKDSLPTAFLPSSSSTVDVIGPRVAEPLPTIILGFPSSGYQMICAFTDGTADGFRSDPSRLLCMLQEGLQSGAANPAERALRLLSESGNEQLKDNLTLAAVMGIAGEAAK